MPSLWQNPLKLMQLVVYLVNFCMRTNTNPNYGCCLIQINSILLQAMHILVEYEFLNKQYYLFIFQFIIPTICVVIFCMYSMCINLIKVIILLKCMYGMNGESYQTKLLTYLYKWFKNYKTKLTQMCTIVIIKLQFLEKNLHVLL